MQSPTNRGSPGPEDGIPLVRTPRINPADNAPVRRGTDLFAHTVPGEKFAFFIREWSVIPGEEDRQMSVPEAFAVFFIQEMCSRGEHGPVIDHEHIIRYLPVLYGDGR